MLCMKPCQMDSVEREGELTSDSGDASRLAYWIQLIRKKAVCVPDAQRRRPTVHYALCSIDSAHLCRQMANQDGGYYRPAVPGVKLPKHFETPLNLLWVQIPGGAVSFYWYDA